MGGEGVSGTPHPHEVCPYNFKERVMGEKQMGSLYFSKESIRKWEKKKKKKGKWPSSDCKNLLRLDRDFS